LGIHEKSGEINQVGHLKPNAGMSIPSASAETARMALDLLETAKAWLSPQDRRFTRE